MATRQHTNTLTLMARINTALSFILACTSVTLAVLALGGAPV
ncbi:hypothetical protein [Halochromatium roseum]|nr:hypothetical protein [Halochromatium roseum]